MTLPQRCAFAATIILSAEIQIAMAQSLGTEGRIHGFVLDSEEKGIVGAQIRYSRIYGDDPTGQATGEVTSQADGAFFLRGLASGSFRICVLVKDSDLLNPCQWSPSPPLVNLTPGQLVPGFRIVLQR